MTSQLKQRLIGVVIIFATVAILLPLLFHSSNPIKVTKLEGQTPQQPASPQVNLQLPAEQQTQVATASANQAGSKLAVNGTANQGSNADANTDAARGVLASNTNVSSSASTSDQSANAPVNQALVASVPSTSAGADDSQSSIQITRVTPPAAPSIDLSAQRQTASVAPSNNTTVAKTATISVAAVSQAKPTVAPIVQLQVAKAVPQAKPILPGNPVVSGANVPKAWVVQLASFSKEGNADRLMSRLKQSGYDAYVRVSKNGVGQPISRVFVGPEINKNKIQSVARRLSKQFKLRGLIKRYKI